MKQRAGRPQDLLDIAELRNIQKRLGYKSAPLPGAGRAIIYAFAITDIVRRRLWLSRSVVPFTLDLTEEPEQAVLHALELLKAHDRLESGEPVVIVANVTTSNGYSNAIQVRTIE